VRVGSPVYRPSKQLYIVLSSLTLCKYNSAVCRDNWWISLYEV